MKSALMFALLTLAPLAGSPLLGHEGKQVRIMAGGVEKIIYLPARLAMTLGYFKEEGLEVELLNEQSGIHAEDALLAGSIQGVVGFYDHTIVLQAKGKAVTSVVQFCQAPGETFLVAQGAAPQVDSIDDLKGKAIGVTGLGSSTHVLSRYLVKVSGLRLSQVTFVPVGPGETFMEAMKRGVIAAGMVTEPTASYLLSTGQAKLLVDLRTPENAQEALEGLYPAACLYMQTAWVNRHKEDVQKLVNALVKALKFIHEHSAQAVADRLSDTRFSGDKLTYIKALEHCKTIFIPDGRMPTMGPANVLRVLTKTDKAVGRKGINLPETFTTEFVDQVK